MPIGEKPSDVGNYSSPTTIVAATIGKKKERSFFSMIALQNYPNNPFFTYGSDFIETKV